MSNTSNTADLAAPVSIDALEQLAINPTPPKRKSKLGIVSRYLLWQMVGLLVVEACLAAAGLGEEEIFAIDPVLGMTHMTDKSVTWRKEGYARSYLNWDGLRENNIPLAKPAGTYRIVLLGDSMVEGLQVPLEQTFGQKLEKQLSAKLNRPVQVINFGTSGYSTVQESLLMKRKVFKYAPDMVLLGYDSRDMFENWATPDASLANVRPYALKLPKQNLVIDNSSVTTWLKTPRGKFLSSIGWIRSHSRIWGLISAAETEAGFHNPVYATLMALFTQPGKTVRKLAVEASDIKNWQSGLSDAGKSIIAFMAPSFKIQFFEGQGKSKSKVKDLAETSEFGPAMRKESDVYKDKKAAASAATVDKVSENPPAEKTAAEKSPEVSPEVAAANKKSFDIFLNLMKVTLDALLVDMQKECTAHGAVLCVQGLPSRAALSPIAGMDGKTYGVDYVGEVATVEQICHKDDIPFVDALKPALSYSKEQHQKMFYSAHMTAAGHDYLTEVLEPFLLEQIKKGLKKVN